MLLLKVLNFLRTCQTNEMTGYSLAVWHNDLNIDKLFWLFHHFLCEGCQYVDMDCLHLKDMRFMYKHWKL